MTSGVSPERLERGSLRRLRATALLVVMVGSVGSLAFMFRAGQRTPRLLLMIFVFWVLSPFLALAWADRVSKRWSVPTRATLHSVMLVITLASLAIYAYDALRPRTAQPAFVFVVVPPASWLLAAIVVAMAALITKRRKT
jgi:hypothetical protein